MNLHLLGLAAVAALLPTSAAHADCTVVAGGQIYDGEGRLGDAAETLVVQDGRVVARTPSASFPGAPSKDGRGTWDALDCAWIDAAGKEVARGFVDASSTLGLVEVGMEQATRNHDAGGGPVRASVIVADAYDPSSIVIAAGRVQGVTSAIIQPAGGLVAGRAGWVDLAGDTQAQAVAEPVIAMRADLVETSRAGSLETIRELLDDVRDFDANRSSYDRGARRDYAASRRDLDALVPVVRGNLPLVLTADRGSDIEALLRFAREEQVELVIDGGAEAHLFAAELAAADIPVIVRPLTYGAGRFGQIRARRDGTKILAEAGVAILFSTRSAHSLRKLRQLAGNAVREGLTHEAAMKSTTSAVAEVFGMANRADLSVGAVADLVVWSGDPLELGSRAEHMIIRGNVVSLKGRQEALMERYRTLPGSPVPALELP